MSLNKQHELAALIAAIDDVARQTLPAAEADRMATIFAAYFEEAEAADLKRAAAPDLYGAVMAHLDFGRVRQPGIAKVRLYNPDLERHGWHSTHTVIEIVNDDMPFLIDSLAMLLARHNLALHLLVHPVLAVSRNAAGEAVDIHRGTDRSLPLESFIHAQIDRISDPAQLAALEAELNAVLKAIRATVSDEPSMRAELAGLQAELARRPGCEEESAFLGWLGEGNFLLMGFCDYDLTERDGQDALRIIRESGLGILRDQGDKQFSESFSGLPESMKQRAREPQPLVLNKSQSLSRIHRSAHLDFIAVKKFDAAGQVVGERRLLGLYTARAYHASPKDIPILRQKIAEVVRLCDFVEGGYKAKTLNFVLETYPRDELFEIPVEALYDTALGLVNLQERPRVRLFARTDIFHRYVSCLVFLPRDSFNTELRVKVEQLLLKAFNGSACEFSVAVADANLARVHYIVTTQSATLPAYDADAIEADVARLARGWTDELRQQLVEAHGEEGGNHLFSQYQATFPVAYREEFSPRAAAPDVRKLETLTEAEPLAVKLYRPLSRSRGAASWHLKAFRLGEPVSLSRSLPVLENLGVSVQDEHPYRIVRADGTHLWINDFGLEVSADALENDAVRENLQDVLMAIHRGQSENDGFNRLAIACGLDWREITLVRALAKYLRQAGLTFSQQYVEQCVAGYPSITARLVALFHARLNPARANPAEAERRLAEIREALATVANLDEDRILNGFLTVVLAIRRTNYFQQKDGVVKPYMSFKLESHAIPFLPEPKPLFEIWVYGTRVEGVHLRGSKVARGGLRWSDRMEDFRTEVLGLVKAQMVKNSVIVPQGSKGGFVCKQLPPASDREAWLAEGIACYKTFISGLLDVTDNLVNGKIVPPVDVVRLDEDDPYLVVAADKGTASFSDIANGVSAEYGFWLGDAFASGGSQGYDHKKMGITARGAWESVKRHFRHLGRDIQREDFTVIGIGDMSGDVFGNGMLLSEHIRLIAAFDHRHIFIDPAPDAAVSFAERARLFALPRSSWADYNPELISAGGGVFPRSAKSIELSPQVRAWLKTERDSMAPLELIHAILKAEADLLYNGGIGTYIKASTETHADARDRANDGLRVDGCDLNVRVVGEGGNLGCTQRGRIEFARKGGLICTDAIDNSAGVDCSDHEVNIKILLGSVIQSGDMTLKQRNDLLAEMTDEVGQLVLRNNYLQTEILAVNRANAMNMLNAQQRMIGHLEKTGELNRQIEFLPSDDEINERRLAKCGLTTPEVAVLLAYSKISLDKALLASDLPDDTDFTPVLVGYFPHPLQTRFGEAMKSHHLRREIIANQLANRVVNRMGATFVFRMQEETNLPADVICRAFWAADQIFGAETVWREIEALDNVVPADLQVELMVELRTLVERAVRWLLRNRKGHAGVAEAVALYQDAARTLLASLPELVPSHLYTRAAARQLAWIEDSVPERLAMMLARLEYVPAFFDVTELSRKTGIELAVAARAYYTLGRELDLDWLAQAITRLPRDNRWQSLARTALRDDLYRLHSDLATAALGCPTCDAADYVTPWLAERDAALAAVRQTLAELRGYAQLDLAMLSAGMREIANQLMN